MGAQLLILADDFSGALDTGVKFSGKGITTVVLPDHRDFSPKLEAEVVVVNACSRHLPAKDAAEIIHQVVSAGVKMGIPYIYKKTDSVLRGNVGAELTAALYASGCKTLSFFPAFPDMGRTTEGGIQLFNGTPIHESCIAEDPFEPIVQSGVREIIRGQSQVKVVNVPVHQTVESGGEYVIAVYDSRTNQDIQEGVGKLSENGGLRLLAGCAGLAGFLPDALRLTKQKPSAVGIEGPIVFVCGSLNPVVRSQIAYAREHGYVCIQLSGRQQYDASFIGSREFEELADRICGYLEEGRPVALVSHPERERKVEAKPRTTLDEGSIQVAVNLAAVSKALADRDIRAPLMLSGGDVVMEFMRQMQASWIRPLGELVIGTVVSQYEYRGKSRLLISKSGGFGEKSLLLDILK